MPQTFADFKREQLRTQTATTRCDCGWSFEGRVLDGIKAAQAHRREAHPDRPASSPKRRRVSVAEQEREAKAKAKAAQRERERDREEEERHQKFADLLRERGPLTTHEIRDALAFEDSAQRVRVQLGRAARAEVIEMTEIDKEPYWFLPEQKPPQSRGERDAEVIRLHGPLSTAEFAVVTGEPMSPGLGARLGNLKRRFPIIREESKREGKRTLIWRWAGGPERTSPNEV